MAETTTGPTIDVLGIGNALVDVLSNESDETIVALGLMKGAMQLIDEPRMAQLYAAMGSTTEVSGGSAANTMAGIASLGGSAHYISRVRDDQLGKVFAGAITEIGVGFSTPPATEGPATGCCLILVTPDAERTMNTFLGISAHLGPDEIDASVIARSRVVYLEGYLFDRPEAQEAFRVASRLAHDAGAQVALSLSDTFCVERHLDAFRDLVAGHVDLLFANTDEILALYETTDLDDAVAQVRRHCRLTVITRGAHGALIVTPEDVVEIDAVPVDALVDTTGAGDLFAAGFLFGHSRNLDLDTCGRLGALAAAEVIGHLGPRPQVDLAALAAPLLAG